MIWHVPLPGRRSGPVFVLKYSLEKREVLLIRPTHHERYDSHVNICMSLSVACAGYVSLLDSFGYGLRIVICNLSQGQVLHRSTINVVPIAASPDRPTMLQIGQNLGQNTRTWVEGDAK